MRGHPVHDDPNAHAVRAVNEVHQLFRLAVARGGGVVARHLIAPAWIVWIGHERHDLDMRIAHVGYVVNQFVREFAVPETLFPAAEVHLVDVHRSAVRVRSGAVAVQIFPVAPVVVRQVANERGGAVGLAAERKRIRLHEHFSGVGADCVLVQVAGLGHANGDFPYAGRTGTLHAIRLDVPEIERTNDAHELRIWSPNRESIDPFAVFAGCFVAAKLAVSRGRYAAIEVVECCFIRKFTHS